MPNRHHWKLALVVPALFATMGPTNCSYFSDVVVPATDTTAPILASRMFFDGEETLALWPIEYETDDPDASFVVFPATYDSGGVRSMFTGYHVSVTCRNPFTGALNVVSDDPAPPSDAQNGTVGSLVSNGIYVQLPTMTFRQYFSRCTGTRVVDHIELVWVTTGEDFHFNVTTEIGGHVRYVP